MAHFAQLDENNVVTQVIVVHNNELNAGTASSVDENGYITVTNSESELAGVNFCKDLFGASTRWVQTSYSGSFRGKYAAIGDTYNVIAQTFISPIVEVIVSEEENLNSNVEVTVSEEGNLNSNVEITTNDTQNQE